MLSQCLLKVLDLDAMVLLELPGGCDYCSMKLMLNGTELYIHDFDGCMYGLTTQVAEEVLPLKKLRGIVSWGVNFGLNLKSD